MLHACQHVNDVMQWQQICHSTHVLVQQTYVCFYCMCKLPACTSLLLHSHGFAQNAAACMAELCECNAFDDTTFS